MTWLWDNGASLAVRTQTNYLKVSDITKGSFTLSYQNISFTFSLQSSSTHPSACNKGYRAKDKNRNLPLGKELHVPKT